MRRRVAKFVKDFLSALGECFLSEFPFADNDGTEIGSILGGILGLVLLGTVFAFFVSLIYGFLQAAYELMFDQNSNNVASRLASLSISPDKQV